MTVNISSTSVISMLDFSFVEINVTLVDKLPNKCPMARKFV